MGKVFSIDQGAELNHPRCNVLNMHSADQEEFMRTHGLAYSCRMINVLFFLDEIPPNTTQRAKARKGRRVNSAVHGHFQNLFDSLHHWEVLEFLKR